MRKLSYFGTLLIVLLPLSGCIYSKVKFPLDTDVSETVLGEREGRATMRSVLGLFAWGDASTAAAASNGSITTINHLDAEQTVILFGLYADRTTIAYGD